jgi:hypothetical protein
MPDQAETVAKESLTQAPDNSKNDHIKVPEAEQFSYASAYELALCFFGLQGSYLIWGLMQELIMDSTYTPTPLNPSGRFPSATFCVFSNRFLAIIVAAIICRVKHGTVQLELELGLGL